MNAQRISTTVSYEQWQLVNKERWKWSELIKLGIATKIKPDVLTERLQALEAELNAYKLRAQTKKFMNWRGN